MTEENAAPEAPPETAPEAEPTPTPQDEAGETLSLEQLKALNEKLLKEKRAANREAQVASKRAKELEAKEEERKQAEMSELEKAQAESERLKLELETERAVAAKATRTNLALAAGVDSPYAESPPQSLPKKARTQILKSSSKDSRRTIPRCLAGTGKRREVAQEARRQRVRAARLPSLPQSKIRSLNCAQAGAEAIRQKPSCKTFLPRQRKSKNNFQTRREKETLNGTSKQTNTNNHVGIGSDSRGICR